MRFAVLKQSANELEEFVNTEVFAISAGTSYGEVCLVWCPPQEDSRTHL